MTTIEKKKDKDPINIDEKHTDMMNTFQNILLRFVR